MDDVFGRMWDADYLRHIIRDETAALIVAASGAEIIGMVAAPQPGDPDTAGVSRLCVRSAYREGLLPQRLLWVCEECLPQTVKLMQT